MAVIDDIKTMKPNGATDAQLALYIRRADTTISKYLNNDMDNTTVETTYPDAVIEYVIEALNRQGDEGVKVSEISSVQNTYELGISQTVMNLLPVPSVRLV